MYVGVTNDLKRRLSEHKSGEVKGFTKAYNVNKLVYYERYHDPLSAIDREKQLKNWKRVKKDELIKRVNPDFEELEI